MVEVGDRVVCVDDSPVEFRNGLTGETSFHPCPLSKGVVYTVRAFFPAGTRFKDCIPGASTWSKISSDHISVGVAQWHGRDTHRTARFRKLRDISQSLRELKELAINCPALVEPVSP